MHLATKDAHLLNFRGKKITVTAGFTNQIKLRDFIDQNVGGSSNFCQNPRRRCFLGKTSSGTPFWVS
jgi:hypothetical protein